MSPHGLIKVSEFLNHLQSGQHDFLVKIVVKVLMKTLLAWWFNYDWIAPVSSGIYNKKDSAFMLQHKRCLDKVMTT
jgi:hypothetical protein